MSGFATPPMRRPSPAASSTAPMRNLGYSPPPCLSKHPIIAIPNSLRREGKCVHAGQSDLRKRPKKVYAHIAMGCSVASEASQRPTRRSSPNRRGPRCARGASCPESVRACIPCRKLSKSGCRSKSRPVICVGAKYKNANNQRCIM